ncbi:juvenile hormone esterase-like [Ostrinia furnacalis]|uniref:juvenile hormone esterase-like n=1 Tax=Ostrinia furnacalis TaxID=93504 RepID=UPI00103B835E|nr:juvenile hormone esterase-like [Ostrinia furnacalis]
MKVVLGVIVLISYVASSNLRVDPLVLIEQGLVRGQRAEDGDYTTFLGIPYAAVDENNPFGSAKPPAAFEEEIYKANDGTIRCPQTLFVNFTLGAGTETLDCLRLNIYVPNEATSKNPLPVLVWIHGGGFELGSASSYNVISLVNKGIVVVTINYRMGPYGFMCLDVPSVPGNQGLKDQYAALQWVRNNIGSFGGNPYNVTVAGDSAGACSTLLHLYSSKDKLFHKVIVQSGTPQNEGMFVNGDVDAAKKLANYLGFNTDDTEQALEFLAKTPFDLVTAATVKLDLQLKPCQERSFSGVENFVETDPYSLSNEKKISGTPILIGHTSKEEMSLMSSFYEGYYRDDPFYTRILLNYNLSEEKARKVADTIRHFYIGDKEISQQQFSEFGDFESDFIFNHPMQRMITKLLNESPAALYQYLFSYVGNSGKAGAGHGEELKYLFQSSSSSASEDDKLVAERMVAMWANFIKTGNPTPSDDSTLPVTWTKSSLAVRPYLLIDKDLKMESRLFNERMAFWDLFNDSYGTYNKLARNCNI